jgi:hypothetical protein
LLDRVGHFRDGGPRDLIQQLVRIFFLRQRLREERYNGAVAQLLCEIFCGRVAGNLVGFDPLCRANKCEVGESVLLSAPSSMTNGALRCSSKHAR